MVSYIAPWHKVPLSCIAHRPRLGIRRYLGNKQGTSREAVMLARRLAAFTITQRSRVTQSRGALSELARNVVSARSFSTSNDGISDLSSTAKPVPPSPAGILKHFIDPYELDPNLPSPGNAFPLYTVLEIKRPQSICRAKCRAPLACF